MSNACGTEAGAYLRLIDSRITQLKAQGPSRTCNESREEVGVERRRTFSISEQLLRINVKRFRGGLVFKAHRLAYHSTLGWGVIKERV